MSDLANQRDDFERRLAERDKTIGRLRARIEEIETGVREALTIWDADQPQAAYSELMGLVRKIDRADQPEGESG